MKPTASAPIGIFDSGIGGMTVVKSVMQTLPGEDIIYFGDTARVPYGTKSMDTVREYALQITDFLLKKKVKMILIACNTVAASARQDIINKANGIPVLDVVLAGAKVATETKNRHQLIGVIGTIATVGSGAYEQAIAAINKDISVFSKACPLLVPLAEEGWTDNDVAERTVEIYLEDFRQKPLDALILGCTHYPLFKDTIRKYIDNKDTEIIDSADSIASNAREHLEQTQMLNTQTTGGKFECFVSDKPQRFQILAERFLGKAINRVEVVNMR
jgi:glutamate racemase